MEHWCRFGNGKPGWLPPCAISRTLWRHLTRSASDSKLRPKWYTWYARLCSLGTRPTKPGLGDQQSVRFLSTPVATRAAHRLPDYCAAVSTSRTRHIGSTRSIFWVLPYTPRNWAYTRRFTWHRVPGRARCTIGAFTA